MLQCQSEITFYYFCYRPLRGMALLINVPEVSTEILAERLRIIADIENLNIDIRSLLHLVEKSGCDVRACLGVLQYTGGNANMLKSINLGLKDTKKGLFDLWKNILQIPMTRQGPLSEVDRVRRVFRSIQQGWRVILKYLSKITTNCYIIIIIF